MENNNNVNLGLKFRNLLKNIEFYLYKRGRHARALCLYPIPPPLSFSFFLSSLSPFFFLFASLSDAFSSHCFSLLFQPPLREAIFFANNQPLRGEHIK